MIKIENNNELYFLVQIFLKATGRPHLDHIYLLNNKYYFLQSISQHKGKYQNVFLIETDIDGKLKGENDSTTVLDVEFFKKHATIVGVRKN